MKCKHNYVFDNVRNMMIAPKDPTKAASRISINTYHCTKCCDVQIHDIKEF